MSPPSGIGLYKVVSQILLIGLLDIFFRTINWDMFNQLGLSRLDVLSPIDELIEGFSHENQPLLVDFPTASPWRVKNECPVGHPMCQLWLWEWRKQHTKKMCVCADVLKISPMLPDLEFLRFCWQHLTKPRFHSMILSEIGSNQTSSPF